MQVLAVLSIGVVFGVSGQNVPWEASPRAEAWWVDRHYSHIKTIAADPDEIRSVFYGDSQTEGWPSAMWNSLWGSQGAYKFGIGGDRTQHILWRMINGECNGINPKVVIVQVGGNNLGDNNVEEVTRGIVEMVNTAREYLPDATVLLMAVFPRNGDNARWQKVWDINRNLETYADNRTIYFFDIWDSFVESWGVLKPGNHQSDGTHLNSNGYQVWYDAMNPLFQQLING